jgi:hypothetical protein
LKQKFIDGDFEFHISIAKDSSYEDPFKSNDIQSVAEIT